MKYCVVLANIHFIARTHVIESIECAVQCAQIETSQATVSAKNPNAAKQVTSNRIVSVAVNRSLAFSVVMLSPPL